MLTILLLALLLLLPIAALAIALTVLHWKAWVEAQARAFDSSLDHVED
jgi:L-lactate permease